MSERKESRDSKSCAEQQIKVSMQVLDIRGVAGAHVALRCHTGAMQGWEVLEVVLQVGGVSAQGAGALKQTYFGPASCSSRLLVGAWQDR